MEKENTFIKNLQDTTNFHLTENGALTHSYLDSAVYQLFAFGGAYRSRSDEDCILLFKNAFEENESLALKCLFWIRDCRGGTGERRFFRVCYRWLAQTHPEAALRNMKLIPEYGRVDDLYCLDDTPIEKEMYSYLKELVATACVKELVNN